MSLDERLHGQTEAVEDDQFEDERDDSRRDELERLRRENAHLRQRHDELRQTQYRRTTVALAVLGVAGLAGALAFPPVRETLVVLGAIGLFAAVVTRYLSPEQFIPIGIGSAVFEPHAANHDAVVDELGLQDTRVYVPDSERETVRLFVPEHRMYTLPDSEHLRDTFVVTDDETARGVAFTPSGTGLYDEFQQHRDGPLGDDPKTLARQSADALTELFELVETADAETDPRDGRLTVRLDGCRFASAETFDTPVASFLGVAVARGLDTPVTVDVTPTEDADFTVTCRWDVSDRSDSLDSTTA
ncbi:hypothetical protein [Haloferax sp. YSSS75]|uniref:hypothetical protein n=1 Tax=Haloferax sp. YSSS75 TaxID=3388564 RepID=UPI00398D0226